MTCQLKIKIIKELVRIVLKNSPHLNYENKKLNNKKTRSLVEQVKDISSHLSKDKAGRAEKHRTEMFSVICPPGKAEVKMKSHHCTPVRAAKRGTLTSAQRQGRGPHSLLVGPQNGMVTLEGSWEVSYQSKHIFIVFS